MAVDQIEKYSQKNGEEILKVLLKPTKNFPNGYFYCDASDEELVRQYTWHLHNQKDSYVVAVIGSNYSRQGLYFHQEKTYSILSYHPDYINHIDGVEFDNINNNLDVVNQQQNNWCKVSKGYQIDGRSFQPKIAVNSQQIWDKCVRTEVEACISAYQLELEYEDYRYDFLKDRRKDTDILDLERTGIISEEEAIYRHVLRYADNAWFYYRYNLAEYFKENHIQVPDYAIDGEGYMTHPVTGVRLCLL